MKRYCTQATELLKIQKKITHLKRGEPKGEHIV